MRIAIFDDYQDAVRSLECFARLAGHDVHVYRDSVTHPDEIAARLHGFDAVVAIRERTCFSGAVIARVPERLKLISLTGPLRGQVDSDAAMRRGIIVCDGRSNSGTSAPELTWALILAGTRCIALEDRRMREGRWQTTLGRVLAGRTLGILGYGRIGSVVAGYGHAFGMRVVCWGREQSADRARRDGHEVVQTMAELFARSDVLSLHMALNEETSGIVKPAVLALMKQDSLLVNTARAALLEPGALVAGLRAGRPGAAALDVFDVEPTPPSDPLLSMDNVVCSPHLGYVSREGYEALFGDAFDNCIAYFSGKAPAGACSPSRG